MSARGYSELPVGPVILDAGNSRLLKTGAWRTINRPVFKEENCSQCLLCWLFCPDMAVRVEDGKVVGFDYEYCKGCGVCAQECPGKKGQKAIAMEEEKK
ncbi:MAG TPA: pyruvate ferredoxin oxidoreductase [Desulfotomaculum sp.]|nr:pyruvate ferredoxin oxidoreductase [Desulfotomaculum sp.]